MAGTISRSDILLRFLGEDNTSKTLKNIDRNLKSVGSTTEKLSAGFGRMKNIVAGLGLVALGNRALNSADQMQKLSDRLGISTEALSQLKFAGEQTGVGFNTLSTALQRMGRRVSDAARGTGEAKDALMRLGLSAKALNEIPLEQQLEAIAEQISNVGNQSDRNAILMKIFDTEGVALAQTMQDGAAGIRELRDEADKLGLTLSRDQADAAAAAKDAINELKGSFEGMVTSIATSLAGPLADFATWLGDIIPQAVKGWELAFKGVELTLLKTKRSIDNFFGTSDDVANYTVLVDRLNEQLLLQAGSHEAAARAAKGDLEGQEFLRGAVEQLAQAKRDLVSAMLDAENGAGGLDKAISDLEKEMQDLANSTNGGGQGGGSKGGAAGAIEDLGVTITETEKNLTELNVTGQRAVETWLTELEVTGPKAANATAEAFQSMGEKIADTFSVLAFNIGGFFGNLAGQLSNIGGSIAGIARGGGGPLSFLNLGLQAVNFIGDLLGFLDSNPPRISVTNTLSRSDPTGIRGISPFTVPGINGPANVVVAGRRVTEELGRDEAQSIIDALVGLDEALFPLLDEAQRRRVGLALIPDGRNETSRLYSGDFTPEEIVADRFETILSAIGGTVENLVRGTNFNGVEQGVEALASVQSLMANLALSAQDFVDAASGPGSLLGVIQEGSVNVIGLADNFSGTLGEIQALDQGLIGLGQSLTTLAVQVAQARQQIDASTESTIFGLTLNAAGSDRARLDLIDAEIQRLYGTLPGLNDPGQINQVVAQILGLINQGNSLARSIFGDDERAFQAFTQQQIGTATAVQEAANARLDEIIQQGIDAYDEAAEASRVAIEAAGQAAGDSIATAMQNPLGQFAGHIATFGGYVQNINVTVDLFNLPEEVSAVG